jgi:hypothetical protein
MESFDYILTPTSPPLKDALIDSAINTSIFSSLPFEQASEYWQANKKIDNNYYDVNCLSNFFDYSSITDTPNSEPSKKFHGDDENYFKFDIDTIEKYMPTTSDILQLDEEYINYNEENCHSKNNSPCSSPWIGQHQQQHDIEEVRYADISSHENNNSSDFVVQLNTLPSINQVFTHNFSNYTTSPQDDFISNSTINDENLFFQNSNYYGDNKNLSINPDYNYTSSYEDKPNREFKDIWSENDGKKEINCIENVTENIENFNELIQESKVDETTTTNESEIPLICYWENCNLSFDNQTSFVSHIEKKHVCIKKGDEYTCHWHNCPRNYLPFNARYKLLIHMRGE